MKKKEFFNKNWNRPISPSNLILDGILSDIKTMANDIVHIENKISRILRDPHGTPTADKASELCRNLKTQLSKLRRNYIQLRNDVIKHPDRRILPDVVAPTMNLSTSRKQAVTGAGVGEIQLPYLRPGVRRTNRIFVGTTPGTSGPTKFPKIVRTQKAVDESQSSGDSSDLDD